MRWPLSELHSNSPGWAHGLPTSFANANSACYWRERVVSCYLMASLLKQPLLAAYLKLNFRPLPQPLMAHTPKVFQHCWMVNFSLRDS